MQLVSLITYVAALCLLHPHFTEGFISHRRYGRASPISSRSRIVRRLSGHGGSPPRGPSAPLNVQLGDNDTEKEDAPPSKEGNIVTRWWKAKSSETKDDIITTVGSIAFAVIVRVFLYEPRFIPSLSMFPTFDVGDQLLVDKISVKVTRPYQRRDVVVFNPSDTYVQMTGNTEALIKRVVAVAGDTVEVKDHRLYINGVMQDEAYTNELPDYNLPLLSVPKGMLLVLGDNRNHSFDSHVWGFLPEKNVIGRAVLKYWPPWRVGYVEGSN